MGLVPGPRCSLDATDAAPACVPLGWLEGVRLADGEKGWVPQAYVEEISSLSARLRNLRPKTSRHGAQCRPRPSASAPAPSRVLSAAAAAICDSSAHIPHTAQTFALFQPPSSPRRWVYPFLF